MYFSREHPLACWLSTIFSIFSSTILANFLLNEPVISALGNTQQVLWATGIWYLIYYSPFDLVNRTCQFVPIKIVLYCLDDIYNCKSIHQGILHASRIFPDSYVVMGIIGVVKGNGPGFSRTLERLIRGTWSLNSLEFTQPSYSTKISALVTIVLIANRNLEWLMISHEFVFFCLVSTCVYSRLSAIVLDIGNPFSPLENAICLLLFGGIWDALAKALVMDKRYSDAAHSTSGQLRARALKADLLYRGGAPMGGSGRIVVEKVTS